MLRKQALDAVLRVARLREQQAAAVAQRERQQLNDAIAAANQLDQFASEYRKDLSEALESDRGRAPDLVRVLEFARKLESTAQDQRQASQPLKLRAAESMEKYYALRLKLDGLEKLELQMKSRLRQELSLRESRETEDAIASRLGR
jgi:flagellar biosynthesis chaperone FliJ